MLTQEGVIKTYDRWGNFYDLIFKKVFSEGRDVGVELLALKPGEHLLEVGVGTGLSLPLYSRQAEITGIDISPKMLEKAKRKVQDENLNNITLQVMDAQAMEFPDNSFDCVTACYVVSAAPDPYKVVSEIRRVCKPGGRIVFISHFKSQNRFLAFCEEAANVLVRKLGWEATLDLEKLLQANRLTPSVQKKVNLFDYWRAVLCLNNTD